MSGQRITVSQRPAKTHNNKRMKLPRHKKETEESDGRIKVLKKQASYEYGTEQGTNRG